jgi:hypothetical protein
MSDLKSIWNAGLVLPKQETQTKAVFMADSRTKTDRRRQGERRAEIRFEDNRRKGSRRSRAKSWEDGKNL